MSAPRELPHLVRPFSMAELQAARDAARIPGAGLADWLEARDGALGDPLARLAASAGFTTLDMDALHVLQPAFDLMPYGEALQRECLLMRGEAFTGAEGDLFLVIADPFNTDVLAWAEERVRQPKQLRLAHRADIEAYLARHEDSLRAMDSLAPMQGSATAGGGPEDISLRSISEDASPVVRLVNSTLYDALKAGAIDEALVAALQELEAIGDARVARIAPYFSAAFDRWCARLGRQTAWFGAAEPGSFTLGLLHKGAWRGLRSMRHPDAADGGWRGVLPAMQAQIALASGLALPQDTPVFLAGCGAVPGRRDAPGLVWLAPEGRNEPAQGLARMAWGI